MYTQTVTVDTYQPTWFAFNFAGIDELRFDASGGTYAGYSGGPGAQFAMDDFTFNEPSPVPAPAAVWLFGSGFLGLGAFRRKRT